MATAAARSPAHEIRGHRVELPGRGRTFVFDVPGPSRAPTVLLLHGWTATARFNWGQVIPLLARRHRVVAMDQRGHGRGIRIAPWQRFNLGDCADDAVALLDLLGVRRAVVAGYSMGGAIAQLMWRRHPERVSGLVLCSTASSFGAGPVLIREVSAVAHLPAGMLLPTAFPMLSNGGWRSALDAIRHHDARALLDAGLELAAFRSEKWIGDVDVPTAVIVTEHDRLVAADRQRALAAAIPGSYVYSLEADHLAVIRDPEWYADTMLAAVRRVSARPRR